ncbi:MAG: hypothetical protein ABIQ86_14390 [Steroidobacteraceae bacterium]
MKFITVWFGLGLALAPVLVPAAPYQPASDDIVLETLPIRNDPSLAALHDLRLAVQRNPHDTDVKLALTRAYIEAARRDGDPRFLGYAQSTLSQWQDGAPTPVPARVLRAIILQSLHHFSAALADLDAALAQSPGNAQALLTRATILTVIGRHAEAQRDCAALLRSAGEVTSTLCQGGVASVTGRLTQAASLAARALDGVPAGDQVSRQWALTLLAETAARQGDLQKAEQYFGQALAADAADRYARTAYCDLLLDMGKPQQVLDLTAALTRDDNLLLRHALALQALHAASLQSALQKDVDELAARHRAAALRGDRTHLREAARFHLVLLQDATAALKLAQENWQVQKEPADARILLESAIAAHDAAARTLVVAWMRHSGLADAKLAALLKATPGE